MQKIYFMLILSLVFISNSSYGQNDLKWYKDVGIKYWRAEKYDSALTLLVTGLRKEEEYGDSMEIARFKNNIGLVYYSKGEFVKGIFYYEQSLSIIKSI